MSRNSLGEFEVLVLLASLRLGDQAYGLAIADEISRIASRTTSRASVYVTLRRLEQKGLIETRRERLDPSTGGKPRRFVSLRPEAIEMVIASRKVLDRMWAGLGHLLEQP